MIDYVKCLDCGTEKSREDTFLDIPLPVRPFGNQIAYNNIGEALDAFVQAETLNGNNQYFCERCDKKCDALKGLKFSHFPYILTLHLKRFDFDYNTMHRIKLNDKVSFPDVLDLNDYIGAREDEKQQDEGLDTTSATEKSKASESSMDIDGINNGDCQKSSCSDSDMSSSSDTDEGNGSTSECSPKRRRQVRNDPDSSGPYKYELFSIMIHSGSASGGHYYAYIKDFETDEWFCFNDDVVTRVPNEHILESFCGARKRRYSLPLLSSTPYMLMYRQIDKEKNASFIHTDGFPEHIKVLAEQVQKEDEEEPTRKFVIGRLQKTELEEEEDLSEHSQPKNVPIKVRYQVSNGKRNTRSLVYTNEDTLGDILDILKDLFSIEEVSSDQLRLAAYDTKMEKIIQELKNDRKEALKNLLPALSTPYELLLYVHQEEVPESGVAYIQAATLDTMDTWEFAIPVEITKGMTMGMLKEKLSTLLGSTPVPASRIVILINGRVFPDEASVQSTRLLLCSKSTAAFSRYRDFTAEEAAECIFAISNKYYSYMNFVCKFQGLSKDQLTRFGTHPIDIHYSNWKRKPTGGTAVTDAYVSIADTGKTLDAGFSQNSPIASYSIVPTPDVSCRTEGAEVPFANDAFIIEEIKDDTMSVKLDDFMSVSTFESMVALYIGVPVDHVKLFLASSLGHSRTERQLQPTLIIGRNEGAEFIVKVQKPLAIGETYWKIFKFDLATGCVSNLFSCVLSKSMTVAKAKTIILEEMRDRRLGDIPLNRCRLRAIYDTCPKKVLFDDRTLREHDLTKSELVVQELESPEPVQKGTQLVVVLHKFSKEPPTNKELVLDNNHVEHFLEKASQETGIPVEFLDVRVFSYGCKTSHKPRSSYTRLIDDGHSFIYRDTREKDEMDVTVAASWEIYDRVSVAREEETEELAIASKPPEGDQKDSRTQSRQFRGRKVVSESARRCFQQRLAEAPREPVSASPEPLKETVGKSLRKERGLKIYVES